MRLFGALGDIHADFDAVQRIMQSRPEIPFWLCVGDVGDDRGLYEPVPAPLYWIKGNNEDFDFVTGRAASVSNLCYIPNGELMEIQGLRVAGVGGTFAPTWYDKKPDELPYRKTATAVRTNADILADKRRHFVRDEVDAVKRMRGLDVLLTHEAPRPFRVGRFDAGKTPVNEMLAAAKPRLHLFGHHHRFSESTVSGVRSVCLDLVSRSYLLINRNTLEYQREDTQ
jgi:predicted phosphodiesterase